MKDWYEAGEPETNPVKTMEESCASKGEPSKSSWIIAGSILLASLILSGAILSVANSFNSPKSALELPSDLVEDTPPVAEPAAEGPVKVSVDDDPVLGDPKAPLTLIEFSDYECPFCKRAFEQLLPELKKNYIDTGKVKFVYRDFPLPFHANAAKEAEAAQCAKDQAGDTAYFKFHDQIFTKTTTNGTGLALTELPVIAKSIGLNVNTFQKCLDSEKFKEEVAKDLADGTAAGVSGTPSWVVGKSTADGQVEGKLIVGAQPFQVFKTIIEEALNNQ